MGVGDGWEAKGRLYHSLEQEQSCYVINKAQRPPQSICNKVPGDITFNYMTSCILTLVCALFMYSGL